MPENPKIEKRNWEILYSRYEGPEKKAIELIYREMENLILRDAEDYTYHVMPVRRATEGLSTRHAVIVGTYEENELVRRYVNADEIPTNGFLVKVFDDPENTERKLAVITAHASREVFYGATDFVDDYFAFAEPRRVIIHFPRELFTEHLPDYTHASSPKNLVRSVFTWAHPIHDYRTYIDNAARLRLNALIFWNDFLPINARDIADYAHEYGMKLIWGFAWGWSRKCALADLTPEGLLRMKEQILKKYEDEYADCGADGIYFQSFTEMKEATIGDRLVAEVVTEFVNDVASALLKKHPALLLQFGLHASSVKNHLSYLEKLDKRVEIMWEDCGPFPYHYDPTLLDDAEAIRITDAVFSLRDGVACSALYKGHLTLDWVGEHFAHQSGPYILGLASPDTVARNRETVRPLWKSFQNDWLKYGEHAHRISRHIQKNHPTASVGLCGQFADFLPFSEALCAEMLWNADEPYEIILDRVMKRRSVEMV